jgi:cobalt-precorrin-5B (C1)-methyltransferase
MRQPEPVPAPARRTGRSGRPRARPQPDPEPRAAEPAAPEPVLPEPSAPELREPDLPRTARVAARSLRPGWTTGTCSAAAAKAATAALVSGERQQQVEIGLPRTGRRVAFPVARCELGDGWAEAVVVKDAGDDPDVTHGARLTARVGLEAEPGVRLEGGVGVGTVTRPGLGLQVGGPAINPVPRQQITAAVGEVVDLAVRGVRVVISVPDGERMARKTTNPRLGIVGGISILGTTGIVRPFSTAAWRASVEQAVDVIAALGLDTLVLSTGGRTEQAAMRLYPDLDEVCFIEVGDFTGHALKRAVARGLARCAFVGMAGKLAKLGAGVMMTHWTRSRVDPDLLACLTAEAGGAPELVAAVRRANTARHAYELWGTAGLTGPCDLLCAQVAANLARFVGGRVAVEVVMVDFESLTPVGRASAAEAPGPPAPPDAPATATDGSGPSAPRADRSSGAGLRGGDP